MKFREQAMSDLVHGRKMGFDQSLYGTILL